MKRFLATSVIAVSLSFGGTAYAAETAEVCVDQTGAALMDRTGQTIKAGDTSPSQKYFIESCNVDTGEVPIFVEPENSMSIADREDFETAFFAEHYAAYEEMYEVEGEGWAYLLTQGDFGKLDGSPMTPERFGELFIAHMAATNVYHDDDYYVDHDYDFSQGEEDSGVGEGKTTENRSDEGGNSVSEEDTVYDDPAFIAAGVEDSAPATTGEPEGLSHEELREMMKEAKAKHERQQMMKWGGAGLGGLALAVGGFFGYRKLRK